MKMFKYNHTWFLLSFLLLLTACEDGNDFGDGFTATTDGVPTVVDPVSEETYIRVSQTSVSFDATAQTKTITYSANTSFTISISDAGAITRASNSWLTVEQTSSAALVFTVTENTSTSSRSARVVLTGTDASATITVTQEGATITSYPEFYYEIGYESAWNTPHALRSVESSGIYVGYYYLDGEFKFKPNKDDWEGDLELVEGSSTGGTLTKEGSSTCSVSEAGFYMIELDLPNMKYSLTKIESVSLIGEFTDWSSDVDMSYNVSDGCWEATVTISGDTEYKFRANHDWTVNWGGTESNLIQGGDNLSLSVGTYKLQLYLSYEGNNRVAITVSNTTGTESGHEWVDLGLSVRWATTNVGASSPEDYGDYFAWGETTTKSDYSWSTYKYCNGSSSTLTKYCTSSDRGTVDNKTTLEASDDAATANWGGKWRMPTEDELSELITKCTWTWTTQNGINGYKVTGTNGNSIFLPAAGYRYEASLDLTGSYGYYWSSSLYTSYPTVARNLYFGSSDHDMNGYYRYYGRSVRPVTEP